MKYLDACGIFIFEETDFDEHYIIPEGTLKLAGCRLGRLQAAGIKES